MICVIGVIVVGFEFKEKPVWSLFDYLRFISNDVMRDMITCYVMLHDMIMSSLAYELAYACMIVNTRGLRLAIIKP